MVRTKAMTTICSPTQHSFVLMFFVLGPFPCSSRMVFEQAQLFPGHFPEGALVLQSPLKDSRFWLKQNSGKNCGLCSKNIPLANSLVLQLLCTQIEREGERTWCWGRDAFLIVRKLPIIHKGGALKSWKGHSPSCDNSWHLFDPGVMLSVICYMLIHINHFDLCYFLNKIICFTVASYPDVINIYSFFS